MAMYKWYLLAFCFVFSVGFSQKKADTLRLYFGINEAESAQNFLRMDSAVNSLNKNVDVAIYGFADFLSSAEYNLSLSQKRAEIVKNYILSKKSSYINIYVCEGKGERFSKVNSSPEGEAKFRRVDVYFEPIVTLKVAESFLETPKDSVPPKEKKKEIEELNSGESIAIEGLSFVPGRHLILESAVPALQKLLKTMKDNPKLKVEIQGHVCCTNGDEDGLDFDTREKNLSEARAKAIYEYLVAKGISEERLSYKGYGHSKPKEPVEDSSAKEQANRRVEILVLEK